MPTSTQNILNGLCAKTTSKETTENSYAESGNEMPVETPENNLDLGMVLQNCLTQKNKYEPKL